MGIGCIDRRYVPMSSYGAATAALAYAVEALIEASTRIREIPVDDEMLFSELQHLERIARRVENAAAIAELDRRSLARIAEGVKR